VASQSKEKGETRERSAQDFVGRQSEMFSADFSFSGYERDLVAWNLGNGRYLNISGVSGADSVTDGRGSVFADFDNDGDQDIFLRAMHGPAHHLFRNRVGQELGSVRITLEGTRSGKDAFGAVVRLKTSAGIQTQIKSGGGGFLSQSDPRLTFGLGVDKRAVWMEVRWPSGLTQRFPGPEVGTSLLLVEGKEDVRDNTVARFQLPDPLSPEQMRFRSLRVKPQQALPAVTVTEPAGEQRTLTKLLAPGRPTLVNFWATWCQSCVAEMPELEKLHSRSASMGLRVVGISVDDDSGREKIPAFVVKTGVTYPIYTIEPAEFDKLFTTPDVGIPVSILLDEQHRVVDVLHGWSAETQKRLTRSGP